MGSRWVAKNVGATAPGSFAPHGPFPLSLLSPIVGRGRMTFSWEGEMQDARLPGWKHGLRPGMNRDNGKFSQKPIK